MCAASSLELGVPRPDRRQDCTGVLPKQETTAPHFRKMYPMMRSTYEQPLCMFHNSKGLFSLRCLWHLLIDEIHVEDAITVSREARAGGLCTTCCTQVEAPCGGEDVEAFKNG